MTLHVDLVPHLDAGDRTKWQGDQDQRPLTALGRDQALALAEALAAEPVDALYSAPALRCRQTVEPLGERLGLEITVLPELGEFETWRTPDGWKRRPEDPYIGAFAAGSAMAAVEQMRREHPAGRVVACSHGHVIPAFVSFLVAAHGLRDVPDIGERGNWYRLRFDEAQVSVELHEAGAEFPR